MHRFTSMTQNVAVRSHATALSLPGSELRNRSGVQVCNGTFLAGAREVGRVARKWS
ncbi:MAG: hypothetical protein QOG53_474 [Frankiales bacterium]|jgi:hypothetical protein|nr:hypothetical protein [Frankiales bacterium]